MRFVKAIMNNQYILLLLAGPAISLLMYAFTVDYYFFQDDFFHLRIAQAHTISDFVSFFKFRNDIVGFRPITIQSYFFIMSSLFGLNPLAFRIVNFGFYIGSYFLIIKVIEKIAPIKSLNIIAANIWLFASFHFMTISWISASYNLIGTFLWLLTSLLFILFIQQKRTVYYISAIASFVITVASFEFSVTWPIIFTAYTLLFLPTQKRKKVIFSLWPFFAITFIYLFFRLLYKTTPDIYDYAIQLNAYSAKAFFWYLLWSVNIPDEFKYQVISKLVFLNPKFLAEYWLLVTKSYGFALLILILGVVIPLISTIRRKSHMNINLIAFAICWFVFAISPVLIIPNHTFLMYLTLPSIGLYLVFAYFLTTVKNKMLIVSFFLVWFFSSIVTLNFYRNNSYMNQAQYFAKDFAYSMKQKYPYLPKGAIIYYELKDTRKIQAYSNQNELKVIYNDQSLEIYFDESSLKQKINNEKISKDKVITIK